MIFKESHFSQIISSLQDHIDDDPSNERLKKLKLEFIKSKKRTPHKPGFCVVSLNTETVRLLEPALQGPCCLQN